ncbi:MAG: alkaline phosphatase family protein [Petrotogales bacterium]
MVTAKRIADDLLLKNYADYDIMPNFKQLIQNGIFTPMQSSIPEISSVSWSSIVTGKNPGQHNIFGFRDIIPNTYTMRFPNFKTLKAKSFWLMQDQQKHVIINVPQTYPARELNGFHVSGFVALDLERAVYPPTIHLPSFIIMKYGSQLLSLIN